MKYKLSYYVIPSEILDDTAAIQQRIVFSSRSGISLLLNDNLYADLKKNDFSNIPTELLDQLFRHEFIVPEKENEFAKIMHQNREDVKDIKSLATTIQPTANCQLGCHYCGQVHRKETMGDDLTEKIVQRIRTKMETGKFKLLDVTWYGGEPLLGYSQIKSMTKDFHQICKETGAQYTGFMITNGLSLKPEVFKELYLKNDVFKFQITIDGTKDFHDQRRVLKKGRKGTFDIIMKNVVDITNLPEYRTHRDRPVLIRMNIDTTNHDYIPDFLDYLADLGLTDKIGLSFAPVINWGDLQYGSTDGLTKEKYAEKEIDWFIYAMKKGFQISEILPERAYQPCMVVDENAEVYDTDGNIFPCYEFSYTPAYQNEDYIIANLKDENPVFNQNVITRNWFDDLEEGNISTCKTCTLLPSCGGGCVKKWYASDPEPACPSYKFNMEDRLVLEYLRLSKPELLMKI